MILDLLGKIRFSVFTTETHLPAGRQGSIEKEYLDSLI